MMSESSWFARILSADALATFKILPRNGRIAWVSRSRACLAEPPALSPSTRKISVPAAVSRVQSASLPGSRNLRVAVLPAISFSWRPPPPPSPPPPIPSTTPLPPPLGPPPAPCAPAGPRSAIGAGLGNLGLAEKRLGRREIAPFEGGAEKIAEPAGEMQPRLFGYAVRPRHRRVAPPADLDAAEQIRLGAGHAVEQCRAERCVAEDLRVGMKAQRRAAAVLHRPGLLGLAFRHHPRIPF